MLRYIYTVLLTFEGVSVHSTKKYICGSSERLPPMLSAYVLEPPPYTKTANRFSSDEVAHWTGNCCIKWWSNLRDAMCQKVELLEDRNTLLILGVTQGHVGVKRNIFTQRQRTLYLSLYVTSQNTATSLRLIREEECSMYGIVMVSKLCETWLRAVSIHFVCSLKYRLGSYTILSNSRRACRM